MGKSKRSTSKQQDVDYRALLAGPRRALKKHNGDHTINEVVVAASNSLTDATLTTLIWAMREAASEPALVRVLCDCMDRSASSMRPAGRPLNVAEMRSIVPGGACSQAKNAFLLIEIAEVKTYAGCSSRPLRYGRVTKHGDHRQEDAER